MRLSLTNVLIFTLAGMTMNRTFLSLAAIGAVGVGGMAVARHDEISGARVIPLSRRDIVEKLDGKDAGRRCRRW